MAISVTHKFQSLKGDGADATLIRPSNWNDTHNLNMATNNILGRLSAGTGTAEEIPATSYMLGLLAKVDYAALAAVLGLPTTGDARLTFKTVADSGWVLANDGSIGDGTSGATLASSTTQALFTLFYNNFSDAIAPILTQVGGATTRVAQGTASNAYNTNHCRLVLPKILGRALIIAGTGAGLTARALGSTGGEESHILTTAEIAKHTHTGTNWSGSATGLSGSGTSTVTNGAISGVPGLGTLATSDPGNHQHDVFIYDPGHTHGLTNGTSVLNQGAPGSVWPGGGGGGTLNISVNSSGIAGLGLTIGPASGIAGAVGNKVSGNGAHTHTFSGALTAGTLTLNNTAGTCSVTTNVTLSNIGGTTDVMPTGDGAHNNMQPWTAWNIMIRL
jgi:microcystin-dependent protein